MKRFVCWGLVICLMLTGWALAEEENEEVYFEPALLSAVDLTATQIMKSAESRAFFSVLAIADLTITNRFEFVFDLSASSYVGRGDNLIYLYLHLEEEEDNEQLKSGDSHDLMILYSPIAEEAAYLLTDDWSDLLVEYVLDELCVDGWYENDIEELYEVGMKVIEVLEEAVEE